MDSMRIGRALRALRRRLRWRQVDLASRAGVSQPLISQAERGRIGSMQVRTLQRVASALDAELVVLIRWRGGELDRLLDEAHAGLVGAVASLLGRAGWEVEAEVTFAIYADRGSIDLLAWHAPSRTLLIVEVKTELVSVEETLRRHDTKVRVGARVARERFGWDARLVARLLVLPDDSTPRRRVARHEAVLGRAYPLRGPAARQWLRDPRGAAGLLLFFSSSDIARGSGGRPNVIRKRVQRRSGSPR